MPAGTVETGTIWRVALAVGGSALPTIPAAGSDVTWADPWNDVIGGDNEDEFIDEDSIQVTPIFNATKIMPPLAQGNIGQIVQQNAIEAISFACFNVSKDVLKLDSFASESSGEVTFGTSSTKKAVCFEVKGQGIIYVASVDLRVTGIPGGPKTLAKVTFTGDCFSTASVPGAWKWSQFDA